MAKERSVMNIQSYRKGDLTISPSATYMVNGQSFTGKEFKSYIEGLEEEPHGEPDTAEPAEVKKGDRKKRRSSTRQVQHSEAQTEQAAGDVQ